MSPCIALDALLAGGQPLDAALLFAVNNLGGLNCTKVSLFKVVRGVMHHDLALDH